MYLKLDVNGNILSHDYYQHDDFVVEIPDTILVYLEGDLMGVYKYKYVDSQLVELSQSESEQHPLRIANKATEARAKRDQLIKEVEWILFPHSIATPECKAAVTAYIQNLRDISDQEGFPFSVDYGVKPAYVKV